MAIIICGCKFDDFDNLRSQYHMYNITHLIFKYAIMAYFASKIIVGA